jgi:hypothetical protein
VSVVADADGPGMDAAAGVTGDLEAEGPVDPSAEAPAAEATFEQAPADPGAGSPERGFPGFPSGDPRQPPLSRRPRGLDARPVPGGGDPELTETIRRERPYMRLLVAMVAVIVGGSLILTFLAIASAILYR